ncbi:MAG: DUF1700 domain-containing protein [Bacilli bacterium]|nr:DUF1700 domain-containing protein [Bacilli bacterium]
MNKERFLKDLEKKLAILSEEERQDTINEYRDIIEEKVRHGKTESEAVKEFGSIDELAKEILSAYKINPEFDNNEKSFSDECETFIKKGAKKLSDITEDVVDNFKNSDIEFNTQTVFEIAIKVLFALIALAILKLPFYIISEMGQGIFNLGSSPFNEILSFIWKIIVEVAYLALCVLLIANLISKYTNPNKKVRKKEQDQEVTEENIEEIKENKKKIKNNNYFSEFIILLIKIFIVISFLFPIWGVLIGVGVLIALAIYLIIKGVLIYGILILLIGIFGLISSFTSVIFNLLFNHKKISYYPFIINIIICIVGGILTLDYVTEFEYYNILPESEYSKEVITFEENVDMQTDIAENYSTVINNNLENNKLIIEVTYYKDYIKPFIYHGEYDNSIHVTYENQEVNLFTLNKNIINDLKNKTLYNYDLLDEYTITIYANENTLKYLN